MGDEGSRAEEGAKMKDFETGNVRVIRPFMANPKRMLNVLLADEE